MALRKLTPVALALLAAACLAAATAGAARDVRFGVKDDAWLLYGPGTLASRLTQLDRLGVDIVRFSLRWDDIAVRQPLDGRNPRDRAYRLESRRPDPRRPGAPWHLHRRDARGHTPLGERRRRA